MNDLVSIILPVYNAERYIDKCITSLLEQTYQNFELLIVNDGSTDKSLDKLLYWESLDDRIKVFNQDNHGLISTLNFLIAESKGKFIARMDADDFCSANRLERQVAFANKGFALIGSDCYTVDEKEKITGNFYFEASHLALEVDGLFRSQFCHPSVFFNCKIIPKNEIYYDPKYPHAEDTALWFDLIRKYKSCNIKEKLLYVRRGQADNVSTLHAVQQQLSVIKIIKDKVCSGLDEDIILALRQRSDSLLFFKSVIQIMPHVNGFFRKYALLKKAVSIVLYTQIKRLFF